MLWTPADPEKLSLHNDVLSASSPQKSRQAGRTHMSKWQYLKSMCCLALLFGDFSRDSCRFFPGPALSMGRVFVNMFSLPG